MALAAQRALVGALLFSPLLVGGLRKGTLQSALRDPVALLAIAASAATILVPPIMFRSLTGPQAALVMAVTPVALVVVSKLLFNRSTRALVAVVISVVAAVIAAVSGEANTFTSQQLGAAALFMFTDVLSMLAAERARERHDAGVLVVTGMAFGAVCFVAITATAHSSLTIATSGLLAATFVGFFGTLARVLRMHTLPKVGAAVAHSNSQVTAVFTAIGGIIIFNDSIGLVTAIFALIAAGASLVAVVKAEPSPQTAPNHL